MLSIQLPWERTMASSVLGTLLSPALHITSLADFNPFAILNHNMSKMDVLSSVSSSTNLETWGLSWGPPNSQVVSEVRVVLATPELQRS